MVPRLPPKQLMLDSLLEERRRGLQRWLYIVSRHPVLGVDPLFTTFLTDNTSEHQEHLRELYSRELDEFSKLSEDVELPLEDQGRLAASREMMRTMLNLVTKLMRLADQVSPAGREMDRQNVKIILFCSKPYDNRAKEKIWKR